MTQEDQDTIVGKAHREYKAAKKELAALSLRLDEIIAAATNLAGALTDPSRMIIPDEGEAVVGPAVMRASFFFTDGVAHILSRDYIATNVKEYKAVKQRVGSLRQKLLSLGENPGD